MARFRDHRPTIIKQLEPQGVSTLWPVTPRYESIFTDPRGNLIKTEYEHLKGLIFQPTTNRGNTRKPRRRERLRQKPKRPTLIDDLREIREFRAAVLKADAEAAQKTMEMK